MRRHTPHVLTLVGFLLVVFPRDVFAYLDPGTGSLFFQTVIAALAGVAYGVRMYWSKIRTLFGGKKAEPSDPIRGTGKDPR